MIKKHYYKIQKKIPFQTNDLLKFSKNFWSTFLSCGAQNNNNNKLQIDHWMTYTLKSARCGLS